MDPDRYLEAIERESTEFASALAEAPTARVPSCPEWQNNELAVHLGIIHRWATQMVRAGAQEVLRDRDRLFAIDPASPELLDWFIAGAGALVQVLSDAPVDQPVWSWVPGSTAGFWRRRQAHETAVHRWDAQAAVGRQTPIEAALASDGIDEWLTVFAGPRSRSKSARAGSGESFHFHCLDTDGEWTVTFDVLGLEVRPEHAKADVAVRGAASDLLLFLWGRQSSEVLEVLGDASMLSSWTDFLPAI